MNSPKVLRSRFVLFWVAFAALALLAAPLSAQTATANPSSVNFSYQQKGQCNPCSFPVQITDGNGQALNVTSVAITQPTSPVAVPIFVYQIAGSVVYIGLDQGTPLYNLSYNYPAGTYSGTALVTGTGGVTVTVPLSITVNTSLNFSVSPTSLATFQVAVGGTTSSQALTVTTNGVATNFTATATTTTGGSWLLVNGAYTISSTVSGSTTLSISVNASGLASGTYNGSINVTPSGGSQISVPVTLIVGAGSTTLTASPASLSFTAASGSSGTQTSSLYLATNNATIINNIYLSSNTCNCITFTGNTGATATYITVSANPLNISTGTYSATIHVTASDGAAIDVPVSFVVGGGTSGFSATPSSVTLYAPTLNVSPSPQSITVSTSLSNVTYTATVSSGGWLSLSGATVGTLSASSATFSAIANTSGLAQGTYTGTITVSTSGGITTSQSIPVTVVVAGGTGGGTTSGTVAPTSLSFTGQAGATNPPGNQYIAVGGNGLLYSATVSSTTGWLRLVDAGGGSTPGIVTIGVITATLSAGTYTGNVTVTVGGATTTIPVTLTLNSGAVPVSNPGGVLWNFASSAPTSQFLSLSMSDGSAGQSYTITNSAPSWITLNQTSGTLPTSLGYTLDPTSLGFGATSGNLTVTVNGQSIVIPVVANVTYGSSGGGGGTTGPLTISPASIAFNLPSTATAQSQTVNLYASLFTSFTVTTSASWLGASQSSGSLNGGTNTNLIISANPAGLTPGTYNGSITIVANGVTQTVAVTLTVTGVSTTLNFNPGNLSFSYTAGATAPNAQTVAVTSQSGSSITFTTSANTSSGGQWLAVTPGTGATTSNLQVSILPNVLTTAGTFNGTITVTPSGGTAQTIPVTVTVTAPPTVTASPTSLTFTYRAGDAAPATQQINVSASNSTAPLTFTANPVTTAGGNWLSATPTSGTTPGTINVNVTPGSLDPGTYSGTITVQGVNGAGGSTTVNVSLTVTAPLPTVSRVASEASGASGAIAPGEIIRITGTAIGPATVAVGQLDSSTGRWQTTVGGVQVLVNGTPAPVIAVSANQVSAIVPYEVAGRLDSFVQIRFRGTTSNALTLPVTTAVPGIFTQNFSGTGPGAIINGDGSINGPGNPAAKSTATQPSIIVVYATGEGLSRNSSGAAPATGQIVNVVNINDLPRPLLPVAVTIDGQPCNVTYAGAAPGQIAGLFQLNVQVPATVSSGNVPIVISVGGNSSPSGVTVSIR